MSQETLRACDLRHSGQGARLKGPLAGVNVSRMRLAIAVVGVSAALWLSACYGSTEPATNVGSETATLNAHGTANNGPAISYFEYWPTGNLSRWRTGLRHWPAGASGSFSDDIDGLYASQNYQFHLCGADDDTGGSEVCAQTREFTTGPPVQDSLTGTWGFSNSFNGTVDAHSGPAGQNPSGTMSARVSFDSFAGNVTCLLVSGRTAKVGAVGHTLDSADAKETMTLSVLDGGPDGTGDKVAVVITAGSTTPPSCAAAPAPSRGTLGERLVVNDAP